jgi:hypothetical protein
MATIDNNVKNNNTDIKDSAVTDKDKDKDKDKDNKSDDCKPAPNQKCPTEDQAKSLKSGQNEIDNIKAKISSQISGTLDALFKNPEECVVNYVASAPNMITGMIEGIGNSVSGSFDKIADSIGNMANAASEAEFVNPIEYSKNLIKIKFQGIFNKIILGENWEHIMTTEKNPNKMADLIMQRSNILNAAFNDLKFKNKFKPWLENYMNSLTKSLKIAKPKIDEIKHEIDGMIEGFGSNIGTTIGNSLANAIMTATSVIPGVGTVISAVNAAGKLGENLIKMCEQPISTVGGIYLKATDAIKKQADKLECETNKVMNFLPKDNKAPSAAAPASAPASAPAAAAPAAGGGGGHYKKNNKVTSKNIKKKIHNTTKRINYLLSRFNHKRSKKINYTRRILKRR